MHGLYSSNTPIQKTENLIHASSKVSCIQKIYVSILWLHVFISSESCSGVGLVGSIQHPSPFLHKREWHIPVLLWAFSALYFSLPYQCLGAARLLPSLLIEVRLDVSLIIKAKGFIEMMVLNWFEHPELY